MMPLRRTDVLTQDSWITSEFPQTSHKERNLQTRQLISVLTLRLCASVFQQDRKVLILFSLRIQNEGEPQEYQLS